MKKIAKKFARFRSGVIGLMIACIAACSLDLPTPIVVEKDLSTAYPCQSRSCGCRNAEQCWASCCCFSDAEKLAWAKANKVQPPDWFLTKLAGNPDLFKVKSTGCCCCDKQPVTRRAELLTPNVATIHLNLRQQKGCQGQRDYLFKRIVFFPAQDTIFDSPDSCPLFAVPTPALPTVLHDPPIPPPRLNS